MAKRSRGRTDLARQNQAEIQLSQRLERQSQTTLVHAQHFEGPIPPADLLAAYDQALPGTAERILVMAEKEQAVRHEIMRDSTRFRRLGQVFAFFLMLGCIGLGGYALHEHLSDAAIAIIATTIGSGTIVTLFARRKGDGEPAQASPPPPRRAS